MRQTRLGAFAILSALALSAPPVIAAGPVDRPAAKPRTEPQEDAATGASRAMLIVRPLLGLGARRSDYAQRITPGLRSYEVWATPVFGGVVEVFPGARSDSFVARMPGLWAEYTEGLVASELGGEHVATSWNTFGVGAALRQAFATDSAITARLGYGGFAFGFIDRVPADALSSAARYRFMRGELEARIRFPNRLVGIAGGSASHLTDLGPLANRFPRATGAGIGATLGVAYAVMSHVELRTALSYHRFFFALKPEPGDRNVAGGAYDEQARLEASALLHF